MNVNSYSKTAETTQGENIDTSNKYQRKTKGSNLDMQDFLNLLTTQLANQDVMNPATDTEFIAQMAQFSTLQAMQTLTEIQYAQYGASMVGKAVLVASVNEKGDLVEKTGIVTKVQFMGGSCAVTVDGVDYEMSAIMHVYNELPKPEEDEDKDENGDDKPDTVPPTVIEPQT